MNTTDYADFLKRLHRFLKQITKIIFLSSIFYLLSSVCYADEVVSSAELINNAKEYDDKIVSYKGEVIGDIMLRKGFSWINVNDGISAIGIWSDKNLIKDILYTGSYKSRGDIVKVKGVFHRACIEHGGDLDIHIEELAIIETGSVIKEKIDINKRKAVFILLGVLFVALALSQLTRKRSFGS